MQTILKSVTQVNSRNAQSLIDEGMFTRLMQTVGPFESRPRLAAAVSGGLDSIVLCELLSQWVRRNSGEVIALIVDHRLRPESADEARTVSRWLTSRRIQNHVLVYTGEVRKDRNIQATARVIRYQLLETWCRVHGVLHLALAHHQEDQAETVLMRLARGSNVHGLAAMASIVYHRDVRIIRPLLTVPKAHLRETGVTYGLAWINEPSNWNKVFTRTRIRKLWPTLVTVGLSTYRLARTAGQLARARSIINDAVITLLTKNVSFHPFGFAYVRSVSVLVSTQIEITLRVLAYLLMTVGGRVYPPRLYQLETLRDTLLNKKVRKGLSLAGCLIKPFQDGLLIFREFCTIPKPTDIPQEYLFLWDRRFAISLSEPLPTSWRIGATGQKGWHSISSSFPRLANQLPTAQVGYSLPALHTADDRILTILPEDDTYHVNLYRKEQHIAGSIVTATFSPNTAVQLRI